MKLQTTSSPKRSSPLHLTTLSIIIFVTIFYVFNLAYARNRLSRKPEQLQHLAQQEEATSTHEEKKAKPSGEGSPVKPVFGLGLAKGRGRPFAVGTLDEGILPLDEDVKGVTPFAIGTTAERGLEAKDEDDAGVPFAVGRTEETCDVYSGRWVYDEATRPLYSEQECNYISPQMRCQSHGRPDSKYQKWRWQPHGCSLPSFNATFMLEKLEGKRVLFVGDSLGASQFFSMVCLLQRAIPSHAKSHKNHGSQTRYTAPKYNVTVEFYWAPFLVESNCDHPSVHRVEASDRLIHLHGGSINKHAQRWKGVDILVFNTYTWWITGLRTTKTLRGSSKGDSKYYVKEMETSYAYRLVLKRMVGWLEKNMDPRKTRVFFTGMSPTHWRSAEWGGKPNGNCYGETTPIQDPSYWGSGSSKSIMQVAEEVLGNAKVPITVLNITQLSEYRKDAHTMIYKELRYKPTRKQLANPSSYCDCVHWCLPGLQDTWNELLYTKLFFP